ncbi:MAG: hypothetical protein KDA80_20750, partial [Planctomycetaceae bacterium]|nr:hypothetical protein [Planctomycetaceae bacterium]
MIQLELQVLKMSARTSPSPITIELNWIRHVLSVAVLLIGECATGIADQQPPAGLFVEGYTSQLSYAPGEEIAFHLCSSVPHVSITIDRVGAERQRVFEKKDVPAQLSPIPDRASSHGCQWPVTFQMPIPQDWSSGYYEVSLTANDSGGGFVHRNRRTAASSLFFVVRSATPGEQTKVLLQLSTNTYNAYTNWGGH